MDRILAARCAELISSIGEPDFGRRFLHCLNGILGIDQCTVFLLGDDGAEPVVAEARTDHYQQLVRDLSETYARADFRRDPMRASLGEMRSGACDVLSLTPDALHDIEYRAQYYDRPNIRHELAMIARLDGHGLYVGLYRERSSLDFDSEAAGLLESFAHPIIEALKKHIQVADRDAVPIPSGRSSERIRINEEHLRNAMLDDSHGLTPREAEVCAGIVLGYTVLGISCNLGISVNTVATHRKRAYAKMRISSQNELFARYFERLHGIPSSASGRLNPRSPSTIGDRHRSGSGEGPVASSRRSEP